MMIIGCDFHPSWEQVAWLDTETGERGEQKLKSSLPDQPFPQRLSASRSLAALGISPAGSRPPRRTHARKTAQVQILSPRPTIAPNSCRLRSFASLRISPAGSRFAHARKAAQVQILSPRPTIPIIPLDARSTSIRCSGSVAGGGTSWPSPPYLRLSPHGSEHMTSTRNASPSSSVVLDKTSGPLRELRRLTVAGGA